MASLESKNTKLKAEWKTAVSSGEKKQNKTNPKTNYQTTQL